MDLWGKCNIIHYVDQMSFENDIINMLAFVNFRKEFSYNKLKEKRENRPGCFILRESETEYNVYYLDVCVDSG